MSRINMYRINMYRINMYRINMYRIVSKRKMDVLLKNNKEGKKRSRLKGSLGHWSNITN